MDDRAGITQQLPQTGEVGATLYCPGEGVTENGNFIEYAGLMQTRNYCANTVISSQLSENVQHKYVCLCYLMQCKLAVTSKIVT